MTANEREGRRNGSERRKGDPEQRHRGSAAVKSAHVQQQQQQGESFRHARGKTPDAVRNDAWDKPEGNASGELRHS
ncbi:unnamed protein product [Lampetra planeri]